MVSPVDKNGAGVVVDSRRTRAAATGGAVGFVSLGAFGDVEGTGVATDYLSQRITTQVPGFNDRPNGWNTHAVTPRQAPASLATLLLGIESHYVGELSPNLDRGVFFAGSPVTDDINVARAVNLYRRTDLRSGDGFYDLLTGCPLCEATSTPLPSSRNNFQANDRRPWLVAASPDMEHVAFESQYQLTADAPAMNSGSPRLYEWQAGAVRYAGRIPDLPAIECDDVDGPVCSPADASIGGVGAGSSHSTFLTPHVVADGSDGHSRVIVTRPTVDGVSVQDDGFEGNLYMRIDGTRTVQLNASERAVPESFAPARYLDASDDGTRVFFRSGEALTEDAAGSNKLYMYDATKPASAPDNLTFLSADNERGDGDGGDAQRLLGTSADGRYVYMVVGGQLVRGAEPLNGDPGIYLWHDGQISYVGRAPVGSAQEEIATDANWQGFARQARVTADGKHLLFSAISGAGLIGKDHGRCISSLGTGCRQLYVYSADTRALACASCPPRGPATSMATVSVRAFNGGTQTDSNETNAITDDGSRVFFSTADALVLEDANGRIDAYEYRMTDGAARLLSSGNSTFDSWFLNASADGTDAFFATRERLVGWDNDTNYDIYDARVGGGFPEPVEVKACTGDACQGSLDAPPSLVPPSSALLDGPGDESATVRPRPKKCRRGYVKKRVRGRSKCVKRRRASRRARRAKTLKRRGS